MHYRTLESYFVDLLLFAIIFALVSVIGYLDKSYNNRFSKCAFVILLILYVVAIVMEIYLEPFFKLADDSSMPLKNIISVILKNV